MQVNHIKNNLFEGYDNRLSVVDEIFLDKGANLPILIFTHGFKGFKDWGHFPEISTCFAKAGFYVVSFNFSHNGGTVEEPVDFPDLEAFSNNSYWRELKDVELLLDWINNKSRIQERGGDLNLIYILGHSRGGAISLVAASLFSELKKVVTWASFSDFEARLPSETVLDQWKEDRVRYVENSRTKQQMPMKYQFVEEFQKHSDTLNIKKTVNKLKIPQLIIHGYDDPSVSVDSAYQLKEWNSNAQLEIIEGAQHTFGGKHPWEEKDLPYATQLAVKKSIQFLKEA